MLSKYLNENVSRSGVRKTMTVLAMSIVIAGCGGETDNVTPYRVTESYDNRAIATAVDQTEDTVVSTGIYVKTRTQLPTPSIQAAIGPGGQGVFVTKHNRQGDLVWDVTLKEQEWNSVAHMAIDQRNGSVVLVGHTGPLPIEDEDLKALDMFDNAVAKDEGVAPIGTRPAVPMNASKVKRSWFIVKLDKDGEEVFRRTWRECLPDTFDYSSNEFLCTCEAKQVAIGATGNIYVSGTGGSPWPMEKAQVVAYDENGNVLWDELRQDFHVGPLDTAGLTFAQPVDASSETAGFVDASSYKPSNYDTARLFHYAWDLAVDSSSGADILYATVPTETKSLRGMIALNEQGDLVSSRRTFFNDLVSTIKPIEGSKLLVGGQIDATGELINAQANVNLLDANLNSLAEYSYSVFDGVTFDMVQPSSDSVVAAANVIGIANKDVSFFRLNGIESNELNIQWDNLYSTTPVTVPILDGIVESYSVDNGKRLFLTNLNELVLVGDALKTEGVIEIDLPDEDFVEPIISGGLDSKLFGFIPLISANFNVDLNLPDVLHIGVLGADSVRFKALFNVDTGLRNSSKGVIGEELSTPYVIDQRADGKLVQVARSWQYDDNNLRSVKIIQE